MLRALKMDGNVKSAANDRQHGTRGRVEFSAAGSDDGFVVSFQEYGNYGKLRWYAEASATRAQLQQVVDSLTSLLSGQTSETLDEYTQPAVSSSSEESETAEAQPTA